MSEWEYRYRAKVVKVIDGDTLDVDVDLGMRVVIRQRLRLFGINTPETYGVKRDTEEYKKGKVSKEYLVKIAEGKEVIIETHKDSTEKYGRYLAVMYIDDVNVGELLVSEGLAERY